MRALHMPRASGAPARWTVKSDQDAPRIMASPPQITVATSPALPKAWHAGSGSNSYQLASHAVGGHFTFCRGIGDTDGPTLAFRPAPVVTSSIAGERVPSGQQFSFLHEGDRIELHFQNNERGYLLKIDGEYLSLTPEVTSGQTYSLIDLGSRKVRRFDLITYKSAFAGVRTDVADTLYAAPVRGPRVICVGDSFTVADADGWTNWFAESLGWDDVWTSGIGATGYVKNASGLALNWRDRVQADVIAYKPEIVFLHGSVNDLSEEPGTVYEAVCDTLAQIRIALPGCIIAGGMNTPYGAEFWGSDRLDIYNASKAAFQRYGAAWLSTLELPYGVSAAPIGQDASLMDPVSAGRPGNGGTPAIIAGQCGFRVNTSSATPNTNLRVGATVEIGTGGTRERAVITASAISGGRFVYAFDGEFQYAHIAGEPVREVAPCYLTGNGSTAAPTGWGNADLYVGSDGYHPSPEGHRALGQVNAAMLKQHLREIGRI